MTTSCCQPATTANTRDLARRDTAKRVSYFNPTVDVVEGPDAYSITMDLPGATRDSLDIAFEKGELTVTARVSPRAPENARVLHREYDVGDYRRSFRLGESIDTGAIEASFANGVLTVRMPKFPAARPRRIEVRA